MVWGMVSPRGLGDYFPDGDYVGWREERADYFDNKMPAEQKAQFEDVSSYRYYAAENLINEPGLQRPNWPPFGPVTADEAPKQFKTVKKYASLAALIKLNARIRAVDSRLKHIIERFEPRVHHFFPIEIVMPGKRIYPEHYFVMAIGQYIDSFLPEQSDPASWRAWGD